MDRKWWREIDQRRNLDPIYDLTKPTALRGRFA